MCKYPSMSYQDKSLTKHLGHFTQEKYMKQGHNDSGSAYEEEDRMRMRAQERASIDHEYQEEKKTEKDFNSTMIKNQQGKIQRSKEAAKEKAAAEDLKRYPYALDGEVANRTRKKGLEKLVTFSTLAAKTDEELKKKKKK